MLRPHRESPGTKATLCVLSVVAVVAALGSGLTRLGEDKWKLRIVADMSWCPWGSATSPELASRREAVKRLPQMSWRVLGGGTQVQLRGSSCPKLYSSMSGPIPDPISTRGSTLTCAEVVVRSCPSSSRARAGAPVMAGRRSERLAPSGGQQGGERGWGRREAVRPALSRPTSAQAPHSAGPT